MSFVKATKKKSSIFINPSPFSYKDNHHNRLKTTNKKTLKLLVGGSFQYWLMTDRVSIISVASKFQKQVSPSGMCSSHRNGAINIAFIGWYGHKCSHASGVLVLSCDSRLAPALVAKYGRAGCPCLGWHSSRWRGNSCKGSLVTCHAEAKLGGCVPQSDGSPAVWVRGGELERKGSVIDGALIKYIPLRHLV